MTSGIVFYDVVVSLHVMAILIAFGAVFSWPVLTPLVTRQYPRALPGWYGAMRVLDGRMVSPMGGVALLLGAYLATDRDYWDEVWVGVPLVILVVVLGATGALFAPAERRLAELTTRDVTAAGAGEVTWSADTTAEARRLATAQLVVGFLVLVAVFFMVAKPGA